MRRRNLYLRIDEWSCWVISIGVGSAFLLALAGVLITAAARADVFEIEKDGTVETRADGAAIVWSGASALPGASEIAPDVPAIAITMLNPIALPPSYARPLARAASRYHISPALLAAVIGRESAWKISAVSPKGAVGLAQLMPATARAMQVDPRDATQSLLGGARYLRDMLDLFDGDIERSLAAYNSGPGRVIRAGGVPAIAETRAYVSTIVGRLGSASSSSAAHRTVFIGANP